MVHRRNGVEHLFVVVVHAQRITALGKDDQQTWRLKYVGE